MAVQLLAARVRWSLELPPNSDRVVATCIDDVGQERIRFDLPARAIPGLVSALEELVDHYGHRFPDVLLERRLASSSGAD